MALGGVGEAMLLGAAVSGGTAAISGERDIKDLLKSAAIGAATGYIGGGGISNLLSGNPLAGIGAEGIASAVPQAAGAIPGAAADTFSQMTAGLDGATAANALTGAPPPAVGTDTLLKSASSPDMLPGLGAGPVEASVAAPTTAYQQGLQASTGLGQTPSAGPSLLKDPFGYMANNKALTGTAAVAGMMSGQQEPEVPKRRKIEGLPIWAMQYNQGGITSLNPSYDMQVGEQPMYARAYAAGGISDLGTYSDGGRMLKGRGDGMSDSIPGVIAGKRPARLADGEFVVPADVVSHLGNGSTDAGAKQLYAMMNKVRQARTGTKKQGRQINPRRFMPA
jgi:hypothetical protein